MLYLNFDYIFKMEIFGNCGPFIQSEKKYVSILHVNSATQQLALEISILQIHSLCCRYMKDCSGLMFHSRQFEPACVSWLVKNFIMCRKIWSRSSLRNSRKKRKEKNAFKRRKMWMDHSWDMKTSSVSLKFLRFQPPQFLVFYFVRPQHVLQKLDNNVKCDTMTLFFIRFFLLIIKCGSSPYKTRCSDFKWRNEVRLILNVSSMYQTEAKSRFLLKWLFKWIFNIIKMTGTLLLTA